MSEIQFGDLSAFRDNKTLFDRHKPQQSIPLVKQDLRLPPYHYIQKYAAHLITTGDEESQMVGWAFFQQSNKNVNEFLRLIEIDKSLIPLIESTDNEYFYRPLFFPKIFINVDFYLDNFLIKGVLLIDENNSLNKDSVVDSRENILILAVAYDMNEFVDFYEGDKRSEYLIFTELLSTDSENQYGIKYKTEEANRIVNRISNYIRNVVCNLIDLVMGNAASDLSIITIETTKEQNLKRVKRGQIQIPTKVFIKPKFHFLKYLNQFNEDHANRHLSHKFLVRGFWRHYRDARYTKMRGKSKYIYPFYKGEGIVISKDYKLIL